MKIEGALGKRFLRHAESIGPMCHHIIYPWGVSRFPVGPLPGYRTRRKERTLPIVRDEFRSAIPRQVARQRCLPPLCRQAHPKTVPGSGTMKFQRTANSVLTVCLSPGDNPTLARKLLGVIYRTLKNKWVFEDFPNFVLAEV